MPKTVPDLLIRSASAYPRRIAVAFGQKTITFQELHETTGRLARSLRAEGLKPGDKAALFLDNCPEFVIGYFALLKAGVVVVPVNYMFKMDEAHYILRHSGASTIITSRAGLEMAHSLRARIDTLTRIICTKAGESDVAAFPGLLARDIGAHPRFTAEPKSPASADDAAVIIYTSGTMGAPKGAVLTHRNLISNAQDCIRAFRISRKDALICILPLFHSFSATVCMLTPIAAGAKIVIMKSLRPFKRVLRVIRTQKVTMFVAIPSVYSVFLHLKLPRLLTSPLISLFNPVRVCVSGAAALPSEVFRAFEKKFRVPLMEGYGLTEASPVVTVNPLYGTRKEGSIGKPLASHIRIKVVDEQGHEVPAGTIGELCVKGPNVMQGYYKDETATREALRDGWLFTGDMARLDTEGYAYIAGRKKEMINVRGLNVYPREIEETLYRHPAVRECAVIGINDERKGEIPKAFVVLKEHGQASQQELLLFLKERLAPYKIPRQLELRTALPKNAAGKILKRLLKDEH